MAKPTSIRIDPAMQKKLERISAAEGGRSVTSIIKQAVQEHIEKWEERKKK